MVVPSNSAVHHAVRVQEIRSYVGTLPKVVAGRHCVLIDAALNDPSATVAVLSAAINESERRADAAARRRPVSTAAAAGQAFAAAPVSVPPPAVPAVVIPRIDPAILNAGASEPARRNAIQLFARTMALPGHDDLIEAAMQDGVSTPQDVATRILLREKDKGRTGGPGASVPFDSAAVGGDDLAHIASAAKAHMAQHPGMSFIDAARAVQAKARFAALQADAADAHLYPGRAAVSADELLHARAMAHMADHPGMSFIDAVRAVGGRAAQPAQPAQNRRHQAYDHNERVAMDAAAKSLMRERPDMSYLDAVREVEKRQQRG